MKGDVLMGKFKYLYLGDDFSVYCTNELCEEDFVDSQEGLNDIIDISGDVPKIYKTDTDEWVEIPEAGKGIRFEEVCR